MKRMLRNAQTFFPFIRPIKFGACNFATRYFGKMIEPEFAMLSRLPPGGVAIDIGGNWGQSILAFQRMAKPSYITSFEPNQILADRLKEEFANDATVQIHACALSQKKGKFDLYVPQYRSYVYDGLASLDRDEATNWLNPQRMMGFDPALLTVQSQSVPVRTLDEFGLEPDYVKIDVQGKELMVVKGGLETFRRFRPLCIIEAPSTELVALMKTIGLEAYRLIDQQLDHEWQKASNVVFMDDKRRKALNY